MNWRRVFAEQDANLRIELVAGITSFLTSAYIIAVNPAVLSEAGMDHQALIAVTCIASGIATLLMAIWPKVPVLMAPGMGLNAFFTFTVVKTLGYTWQEALGFVFFAGFLFFILSFFGLREKIASGVPANLRLAGSVGIGLFIAFLGFHNMQLLITDSLGFPHLAKPGWPQALALTGLILMAFMHERGIRGSLLIGILLITAFSMFLGLTHTPDHWLSAPPSLAPLFGKLQLIPSLKFSTIVVILTFLYVALFDGLGTILAVTEAAGISSQKDYERKLSRMLAADSVSNMIGAFAGTSTVTAYIESATGISQGGRTGWTAFFSSLLFFLSLFAIPFVAIIPPYATAPALIMVGAFMIKDITRIQFGRFDEALPVLLTILLMPLTTSIANGLMFGFISFTLLKVLLRKWNELNPILIGIAIFSLLNLVFGGRFT
ncbi:MAG: guanine permease [Acidobacteria bacterium]|nr:MAG: guanine permease [Acidobacteriota bacterium]